MKKSLAAIAVLLAIIAAVVNVFFSNTYIDLRVSIANIVNVHLGIVLSVAVMCGSITGLKHLKKWMLKHSDEKFAITSYNMLRIRLLLDYGISLPEFSHLNDYTFKRGDPLKFLIRNPHWQEAYAKMRGQIETAYCVDSTEDEVGGYAYVV